MFLKKKKDEKNLKSMSKEDVIDFVKKNYNSAEYLFYDEESYETKHLVLKSIKNTVLGFGYNMETADNIAQSFNDLKTTKAKTIDDVQWSIYDDE